MIVTERAKNAIIVITLTRTRKTVSPHSDIGLCAASKSLKNSLNVHLGVFIERTKSK